MILQSSPKSNYLAHKSEIDAAVARVLDSGWYILGEEVTAFEREFASFIGVQWGVGVANGTDAVELALRACGVSAGDVVLTVSHTAVATVSAISRIGARPLFVDIDYQRYTMDPKSLHNVLKTKDGGSAKALVVVHLYGQPAEMPAIMALAREYGIPVIEDCAQAHGASLDGCTVGNWGDFGCFSFYPTKNLGALGDGGAVVGNDPMLEQRIRLLREYGWRTRYVSESIGLNSRLDEMHAAVLRVKLTYLAQENGRRQDIARYYDTVLAGSLLTTPVRYADCIHAYHQYVIRVDHRDELRDSLRDKGISTLVHYPMAVHQQPAFDDAILRPLPLPNTEAVIGRILSLPMYPELSETEVEYVGETVRQLSPTL